MRPTNIICQNCGSQLKFRSTALISAVWIIPILLGFLVSALDFSNWKIILTIVLTWVIFNYLIWQFANIEVVKSN